MTQPLADEPHPYHHVPLPLVRAAMARAVIDDRAQQSSPSSASATLGSLTLLPHQVDAASRIRAILQEFRVALLADDVGLGKTYVALAIARDYRHVCIIAPAALVPMWRVAMARAQCTHAQLHSLQRYSCAPPPHDPHCPGTLVIIDEAHHLRTPSTRRYRAVANVVAGCDLLLLSATPVHNTAGDLRALLALTLGAQADRLSDGLLARVVVRRTQQLARPLVVEQPPVAVPHDPALLDAILSLPAPLPAHDGAVAGALIRLGLLRAWCSSDAALTQALRQRLLRGEALRQALQAGRHPTTMELRSWLVGEHEVQLAFPELLAGHAPATGPLLNVLAAHLDAVNALLRDQQRTARGDVARVEALRTIMRLHPDLPIVAFSQFATTVRAIGRALSDIAGVGSLTGQRAWIASGSISRGEALACFAPVAQGRPPPPPHQRIRLLLTTDLLAEGVNLQDAGVVVHLDLPWTDALRQQRVGRCVRVGSPHHEVFVYRIEPPPGAEAALQLFARLERKAQLGAQLIGASRDAVNKRERMRAGDHAPVTRRRSPADIATATRALLMSWTVSAEPAPRMPSDDKPLVCTIPGRRAGFVAVVAPVSGSSQLVGGRRDRDISGGARLRLTTSPARLWSLLQAAASNPEGAACNTLSWPRTNRALHRWLVRQALAVNLGDNELSALPVHRRVHTALSHAMARSSPMQRVALRGAYQRAFEMLAVARGVAAERALLEWLTAADRMPWHAWLSQWQSWPPLATTMNQALPDAAHASNTPRAAGRVIAVVLFERADRCARPASLGACLNSLSSSISMER